MAANGLKLLMGDYNSDSETEEEVHQTTKTTTTKPLTKADLNDAVDTFVSELEASVQADTPTNAIVTSWTQCIDQATGHPYYWHTETKEVTWEIPAEYQAFLDQNADLLTNSNAANMWTVCLPDGEDPAGQRYYVNEYTRIVSWDKPVGFVEPAEIVAAELVAKKREPDSPVCKNVIKRRKVPKVEPKPKNENPFSKPSEEEKVKIELISSFSAKSDSSSDEDEQSASKQLKLVATDYNSDTDCNSFALDTSGVICATLPKANRRVAPTGRSNSQPKENANSSDSPPIAKAEKPKKKVNTFASIITGGRSPEHIAASDDAHLESKPTEDIQPKPVVDVIKTQRRKRRIEFITNAPEQSASAPVPVVELEKTSEVAVVEPSKKTMYANFKRSHVEFTPKSEGVGKRTTPETDGDQPQSAPVSPKIVTGQLSDLKDIIEAKLRFLCEGRPDVSAVQAILIQLETLLEAFEEGALQASYINSWLDSIASDLQTLEADAAPAGWSCLWNRGKSQYCYVHQRGGQVRWEYPTADDTEMLASAATAEPVAAPVAGAAVTPAAHIEVTAATTTTAAAPVRRDDDAMDICTTPPPPIADASGAQEDPTPSLSITSELASFYSDLAAIETTSTPPNDAETSNGASPAASIGLDASTAAAAEVAADAAVDETGTAKKKKRKIKKLQPWRSGNLETWINKWAKAQQELEN